MDIPRMMAMPENYAPEEATFAAGLAIFMEKHDRVLNRMNLGRAILHIGRRSWSEKLARNAKEDEPDSDSEPTEERTGFEWTPDAVARNMESVCRRCGFMLRRARWFALLSESIVAWRSGADVSDGLNILIMRHGDVERHYQTDQGSPVPRPPGSAQCHSERRRRIDLMRHDRLRVLTTEMRRLLWEDRIECVRLGKNAYLFPAQLRMLFDWV